MRHCFLCCLFALRWCSFSLPQRVLRGDHSATSRTYVAQETQTPQAESPFALTQTFCTSGEACPSNCSSATCISPRIKGSPEHLRQHASMDLWMWIPQRTIAMVLQEMRHLLREHCLDYDTPSQQTKISGNQKSPHSGGTTAGFRQYANGGDTLAKVNSTATSGYTQFAGEECSECYPEWRCHRSIGFWAHERTGQSYCTVQGSASSRVPSSHRSLGSGKCESRRASPDALALAQSKTSEGRFREGPTESADTRLSMAELCVGTTWELSEAAGKIPATTQRSKGRPDEETSSFGGSTGGDPEDHSEWWIERRNRSHGRKEHRHGGCNAVGPTADSITHCRTSIRHCLSGYDTLQGIGWTTAAESAQSHTRGHEERKRSLDQESFGRFGALFQYFDATIFPFEHELQSDTHFPQSSALNFSFQWLKWDYILYYLTAIPEFHAEIFRPQRFYEEEWDYIIDFFNKFLDLFSHTINFDMSYIVDIFNLLEVNEDISDKGSQYSLLALSQHLYWQFAGYFQIFDEEPRNFDESYNRDIDYNMNFDNVIHYCSNLSFEKIVGNVIHRVFNSSFDSSCLTALEEWINSFGLSLLTILVIAAIVIGILALALITTWYLIHASLMLFTVSHDPCLVTVGGVRHRVRGKLRKPALALRGCLLLGLVLGGEATGVAQACSSTMPFWQKQGSIGEPAAPPEIPEIFPEEAPTDEEPERFASVILMNGPTFLDPWAADGIVGYDPPLDRPFNMIMFGYKSESLGRRDSEIANFVPRTIKEAILATWWDQTDSVFEVYIVHPQPLKLVPEGWTIIINFRTPYSHLPGGIALALKEVIIFRRTGIFPDVQDFEAHPFNSSFTVLIEDAELQQQCNTHRLGHCSIKLDDNLVLRGIIVRVMQGSYVTFMVDEALPDPTTIFTLQDPVISHQALREVLRDCPRLQALNVYLHGYHAEYLGTQSYTAPRTRVENWEEFTAAAARLWQGDIFQDARIISANPQQGLRAVDGEIIVHYIIDFGRRDVCLTLLSRQVDNHLPSFAVVEAEEWITPHNLLQLVDWTEHISHYGLPDISWGNNAIGIDEILQSRQGMHLHFEHSQPSSSSEAPHPHEEEEHNSLMQSWYAADSLHGRTIGRNGQRQLRPPGNGPKTITFSNVIHVLTQWGISPWIDLAAHNEFIEEITSDLDQGSTAACLVNPFQEEFRSDVLRVPATPPVGVDVWTSHLLDDLQAEAYGNPFIMDFVIGTLHEQRQEEDGCDKNSQSPSRETTSTKDRPRVHLNLDRLIIAEETKVQVPFISLNVPDWLTRQWVTPFDVNSSRRLPESLELHGETEKWLQTQEGLEDLDPGHPSAWFIYTDGSFLSHRERASWAIALCSAPDRSTPIDGQKLVAWYGGLLNDATDPLGLQIDTPDSTNAEGAALLWSALLAIAHAEEHSDLTFCYDSLGIGQAAAGKFNYTTAYPLISAVRKLHQAVESKWGLAHVFHEHVKGHSGHPANELVNSLAQEIARLWVLPHHPPLPVQSLINDDLTINNLWLLLDPQLSTSVWPEKSELGFACPNGRKLCGLDQGYDWNFNYGSKASPTKDIDILLDLKIMSFNVQSLLGKVQFLRAQIHHYRYALIGLQETASKEDRISSADGFLRVAAKAIDGVGGVEVWFSASTPIAWAGNRPLYWDLASLIVLHHDSQLMILKCAITGLGLHLIVNGHAPHSGNDEAYKRDWWLRLLHLLRAFRHGLPLILLIDANAQVGSVECDGIGSLHACLEDCNGEHLRQLVTEQATWLPSTFKHEGLPFTWYSSASHLRKGRRIDYVGIPLEWKYLHCTSWVDSEIDTGHRTIDHLALALHVQGPLAGKHVKRRRGDGIDWSAVRASGTDTLWPMIFQNIPEIPWKADTHKHWADLHGALVQSLQKFFPKSAKSPQRHYISIEAWALRRTRNHHKRIWRSAAELHEETPLQSALLAWNNAFDYDSWRDNALIHALRSAMKVLTAGKKLQGLSKQLKQQIREDKKAFIKATVEQAQTEPSNLYKVLRKAGFGSARRQRFTPLPCLLHEGQPCTSTEELQKKWLRHFANIEGGYEVTKDELLQLCKLADCTQSTQGLASWSEMPTLKQVEDGFRRCQSHKAAGTDGIVPELCRKACKWLARATFPLLAKTVIYRSEPVQWKGGVLYPVWKRKGPLNDPHAFRGILVSSQVGKIMHALFRKRALPAYTKRFFPMWRSTRSLSRPSSTGM